MLPAPPPPAGVQLRQHQRPAGPPAHPLHSLPPSSAPSATAPVRLPPVSLPPPTDFLEAPGFTPARRQSVNSDPVLHAFSAAPDSSSVPPVPSQANAPPPGSYGAHLPPHLARRPLAAEGSPLAPPIGASMEVLRAASPAEHHHGGQGGPSAMHDARYPPSASGQPGAHDGYEYGASYAQQHGHPSSAMEFNPASVGPAPSYRFGGPAPPAPRPLDAPSYFDYSMRRHSLSNNHSGGASPERLPHHQQPPPPQQHRQPEQHHPSPSPSLKRKTSDDVTPLDDGYGSFPNSPYPHGPPPPVGAAPHPKRRTSSLTYEKLTNLSLAEQQRRDSSYGPMSPWEDDRRGSGESYASQGSQVYSVPAYQHVHPGVQPYDQRGTPQPPTPAAHAPPPPPGPAWDGQQVGPRGSIARGMYDAEVGQFSRRPSIPSVSQMMQGQQPYYPAGTPQPLPSPHHEQPPPFPPHARGIAQPAVMVSSAPLTSTTEVDAPHSRPASSASFAPHPPRTSGPPPGPPAPWTLGGPPVPPPGLHASRQNSAGSLNLDPMSAYAPGQGPPGKETPYSRSPELRVSHKLAERKRRKEMAQLFDDLREQLPFDRGLKASKWEILSKAIEYVASLKTYTNDLANDNRSLREHFNLPPGPTQPPLNPSDPFDGPSRPMLDSSRGSSHAGTSHEPSPAPAGMPGGAGGSPFARPGSGGPSPSQSHQSISSLHASAGAGGGGAMPPPQWQQQHPPSRPASQASHAGGHPSPAQVHAAPPPAPLKLQQVPGVVAGGMPPQPSPPLSQHSGTTSPGLGHAHSPVVANGGGVAHGGEAANAEQ
ncbi:hypothetical protein JCM10449v2_003022 [Rhodotorula kratochvilovae]